MVGSAPVLAAAGYGGAGGTVQAQEWWLGGLHVTQAWRTAEGSGVTVAVLGTGVAAGHPDLAGSVTTGPDFTGSGRTPGDSFWGFDGTAVAGIIAGHGHGTGGKEGLLGIAPAAKILSVRVNLEYNDPLNSDPAIARQLPAAIAEGITYAVDHGARVIDLPLDPGTAGLTGQGIPAAAGGSPAERAAVAQALRKNVVLVAPAGDDGQGPGLVDYPAAYPGVIAVGATGRDGQVAVFSSRRSYVSLAAPGVSLMAAMPPDDYEPISSTSVSSGIVAGVAALVVSRYPHLTAAQVTEALTGATTTDRAGGPGSGRGIIDAAQAVDLAAAITAASQPARPTAAPTRPHPAVRAPTAAARPASTSNLAGSLVRYVVAGLCLLIVLLVILLLVVRSRRERPGTTHSGSARSRSRGQHEHRRPQQGQVAAEVSGPAGPGWPEPAPPGADRRAAWTATGGWHGGSLGEIQHSPAAPFRPPMAAAPKTARAAARDAASSSGPPWGPAPEPGRTIGPLPAPANSALPPDKGPGIRVPGDMADLPAVAPGAMMPAPFDFATSPDPDFPPRPAAGDGPDDFPGRPGPLTRRNLGFAAAPVPVEHAPPQAPDFTVPSRAGGVVLSAETTPKSQEGSAGAREPEPDSSSGPRPAPGKADPSYIWDLAATDVFPAAVDPEPPPEAPGAAPKDDDPGASGSSAAP